MNGKELSNFIFKKLRQKIENHKGLQIFIKERAKFEGWLKVELCDILSEKYHDIVPEKNRTDIVFSKYAIELKTINTNYRHKGVKNKIRPIAKNIQGIIDDINKLKKSTYENKIVLFIVFPIGKKDGKKWQIHLNKINCKLSNMRSQSINFSKNIPGIIYLGTI